MSQNRRTGQGKRSWAALSGQIGPFPRNGTVGWIEAREAVKSPFSFFLFGSRLLSFLLVLLLLLVTDKLARVELHTGHNHDSKGPTGLRWHAECSDPNMEDLISRCVAAQCNASRTHAGQTDRQAGGPVEDRLCCVLWRWSRLVSYRTVSGRIGGNRRMDDARTHGTVVLQANG